MRKIPGTHHSKRYSQSIHCGPRNSPYIIQQWNFMVLLSWFYFSFSAIVCLSVHDWTSAFLLKGEIEPFSATLAQSWVGRVWSAGEKPLEILCHGWELNPGHKEDRQWAIMTDLSKVTVLHLDSGNCYCPVVMLAIIEVQRITLMFGVVFSLLIATDLLFADLLPSEETEDSWHMWITSTRSMSSP